jgi:hypothetical protein
MTRDQVAEGLRPLLALPVEHVLATHGGPSDRAALERALSQRRNLIRCGRRRVHRPQDQLRDLHTTLVSKSRRPDQT